LLPKRFSFVFTVLLGSLIESDPQLARISPGARLGGHLEHDAAEVDRLASEEIKLSTRHNFLHFLALGASYRCARSASG
jgi:hypothetical protein